MVYKGNEGVDVDFPSLQKEIFVPVGFGRVAGDMPNIPGEFATEEQWVSYDRDKERVKVYIPLLHLDANQFDRWKELTVKLYDYEFLYSVERDSKRQNDLLNNKIGDFDTSNVISKNEYDHLRAERLGLIQTNGIVAFGPREMLADRFFCVVPFLAQRRGSQTIYYHESLPQDFRIADDVYHIVGIVQDKGVRMLYGRSIKANITVGIDLSDLENFGYGTIYAEPIANLLLAEYLESLGYSQTGIISSFSVLNPKEYTPGSLIEGIPEDWI